MFQSPTFDLNIIYQGIVTIGAVIGGIKISMNGIHKDLKFLKTGQADVKCTLDDHGNRLTRVETLVEVIKKD